VFESWVGFEEVVGKMGVREAVDPAIEGDAFEKERGFVVFFQTAVWGWLLARYLF